MADRTGGGAVGWRVATAVRAGRAVSALSRRMGLGAGAIIGGRVTLRLAPRALARLAAGRRVVIVSGTNGKTTTAHMVAAALRSRGVVAHNDTGANMDDGAVTALMARPDAEYAVLEVDELHVGRVADAVRPAAIVLLNLTRDQLDRGTEVRVVADRIATALRRHTGAVVVANADDPIVVGAVDGAARPVWVAAGSTWFADAGTCPRCGRALVVTPGAWECACGLARPTPTWSLEEGAVRGPSGVTPVSLALPGRFNLANAAFALAAADALGVPAAQAASSLGSLQTVAGRYAVIRRGAQELHMYLAKNPAGWAETLTLLDDAPALLLAVNAREADGRDTSWLWDVPFELLPECPTVTSGERAADLGLRLSYADRPHVTEPEPLAGLDRLPPGKVYVVANYTAFLKMSRDLGRSAR